MSDAAVTPGASRRVAVEAARAADDKKADHTLVLFVGDVLAITEYFVITSASNRRLVKSVVDAVEERVRLRCGVTPVRREGLGEQLWVLLDYGDVVVHVFADETRMYYEIERLYRDVPTIDWMADGAAS
jgi:ribosome-associated protein